MLHNLWNRVNQRRIDREFMELELDELVAHANAEFNVVKAQRALEDAELRQQRAKDDALMHKRWESKKLEIQRKYLVREEENCVPDPIPMPSRNDIFDAAKRTGLREV